MVCAWPLEPPPRLFSIKAIIKERVSWLVLNTAETGYGSGSHGEMNIIPSCSTKIW